MKISMSKSVQEFIRKMKSVFESNKVTLIIIILCTIGEAILSALPYRYYKDMPPAVYGILRTLLFLIIPSLFIETYFAESIVKYVWGYIIAFIFSGVAAVCIDMPANLKQMAGFNSTLIKEKAELFLCGILLILSVAVVYRSFQKTKLRFAEYEIKVFYNVMKSMVIWFVLSFGVMFVCVIIEELFFEEYFSLASVGEILIIGFYLAPKMILALKDMDEEPDKILHTIVKYILPLFTLCAMGIVYLYMLKILFLMQMPSNEVFRIISALFCIWLPVWIMTGYYADKTKYMMIISILPYLFIPLILLQGYSIGIRIYQHGMTPERYLGIMLLIFEVGTLVIRHFRKGQYEKLLPFLGILVAIAVFAPGINMNKASNLWQLSFLKKYYQDVESGEALSELAYERLTGAYDYLMDRSEMQEAIAPYDIYGENFAVQLKKQEIKTTDLTQYATYHIHCCQMVGDIELNGYSKMSMLNQNSCYNHVRTDETDVDFSCFQFVRRETGEMFTADISGFAEKCMAYIEEFPYASKEECSAAMKEYSCIELNGDTVLYVNHFEIKYYDGIKDAEPYFEWISINISGMLLQK